MNELMTLVERLRNPKMVSIRPGLADLDYAATRKDMEEAAQCLDKFAIEALKQLLIKAGCTSKDGTHVHASTDEVIAALALPASDVQSQDVAGMREACAKWHDDQAAACRHNAQGILDHFMGDDCSDEDRAANRKDRFELLAKASFHENSAKGIRALPLSSLPASSGQVDVSRAVKWHEEKRDDALAKLKHWQTCEIKDDYTDRRREINGWRDIANFHSAAARDLAELPASIPAPVDREVVARKIDPFVFEVADGITAYKKEAFAEQRENALKKAAAILALLPAGTGDAEAGFEKACRLVELQGDNDPYLNKIVAAVRAIGAA